MRRPEHLEFERQIDDYLLGRLSAEEAECFEKHYFDCPACFQRTAERAALLEAVRLAGPASAAAVRSAKKTGSPQVRSRLGGGRDGRPLGRGRFPPGSPNAPPAGFSGQRDADRPRRSRRSHRPRGDSRGKSEIFLLARRRRGGGIQDYGRGARACLDGGNGQTVGRDPGGNRPPLPPGKNLLLDGEGLHGRGDASGRLAGGGFLDRPLTAGRRLNPRSEYPRRSTSGPGSPPRRPGSTSAGRTIPRSSSD